MNPNEKLYRSLEIPYHEFCRDVLNVKYSPFRIGRFQFEGLLDGNPFRAVFWYEDGVDEYNLNDYLTEMASEAERLAPAIREITVVVPWQLAAIHCSEIWRGDVRLNIRYLMPWTLMAIYKGASFEQLEREFHEEEDYLRTLPIGHTQEIARNWMKQNGILPKKQNPMIDPNEIPYGSIPEASLEEDLRLIRFLRAEHEITGSPFRLGAGEGVTFIGRIGDVPVKIANSFTFFHGMLNEIVFRLQADPRNEIRRMIMVVENPICEIGMDAVEYAGILIDFIHVPASFISGALLEHDGPGKSNQYREGIDRADRGHDNPFSVEYQLAIKKTEE